MDNQVPEKCIALSKETYDRIVSEIRRGHHSERHPHKHHFMHDEFTTLMWLEGDVVWARDPVHGKRRVETMDPQTLTRDVVIGGFKTFILSVLCEADVSMDKAIEIGTYFHHICGTVDQLDFENPLRQTLYQMTLNQAAQMAGVPQRKMAEAVHHIIERQERIQSAKVSVV